MKLRAAISRAGSPDKEETPRLSGETREDGRAIRGPPVLADFTGINKTLCDANAMRYRGNEPVALRDCLRGELDPMEIGVIIGSPGGSRAGCRLVIGTIDVQIARHTELFKLKCKSDDRALPVIASSIPCITLPSLGDSDPRLCRQLRSRKSLFSVRLCAADAEPD